MIPTTASSNAIDAERGDGVGKIDRKTIKQGLALLASLPSRTSQSLAVDHAAFMVALDGVEPRDFAAAVHAVLRAEYQMDFFPSPPELRRACNHQRDLRAIREMPPEPAPPPPPEKVVHDDAWWRALGSVPHGSKARRPEAAPHPNSSPPKGMTSLGSEIQARLDDIKKTN